jgi:hypothetical protein
MLSQTPLSAKTTNWDLGIIIDERLNFDQQISISTDVGKAK